MKFEVGDIIQNNLALDYGIISNIYYDEFDATCIKVIYFNIPDRTFNYRQYDSSIAFEHLIKKIT